MNTKTNQKVIMAVKAVIITILTVNAIRLFVRFAQGGAHPINIAASWFGAGPIMSGMESLSFFHPVDMAASIFSLLFVCYISVVIPCKIMGLLFNTKKSDDSKQLN